VAGSTEIGETCMGALTAPNSSVKLPTLELSSPVLTLILKGIFRHLSKGHQNHSSYQIWSMLFGLDIAENNWTEYPIFSIVSKLAITFSIGILQN
jgi:hypothetical protein